jgi:hypothetical protein
LSLTTKLLSPAHLLLRELKALHESLNPISTASSSGLPHQKTYHYIPRKFRESGIANSRNE